MDLIDFSLYQTESAQWDKRPGDAKYHMLGLVEELGELAKFLTRFLRDGTPIDVLKLKDELGDLMWYYNQVATDFDLTVEEIARANIVKVRAKWEEGADVESK